ncbi:MAG: DNA replication and repair protein RecF [Proteobacteria bacterium]|nr:DNA replication and repair protein RecF [Pseudomonadota bacterium]
MPFINKLKLYNFRNFKKKTFIFNKKINIFYGENGTGKTTILESIYYLSTGKSFRKSNYKNLINFKESLLTVYLESENNNISISKNNTGVWKGKLNNNNITKQSIITNIIPVVPIETEVYRLIDVGPIYRRNFLDWLVFHVKHDYLLLWKKTHKCIKQLNILYKNKAPQVEIDLWESNFIIFSEKLSQIRKEVFNKILPTILTLSEFMQSEIKDLSIIYKQGWNEKTSLKQQMEKDREKNLLYGKLQHGPQKMDIIIKANSKAAAQILSRGQKKILSISFYMAFIKFLNENQIQPIICLDDFDAELDDNKLKAAATFFNNINAQIFITSVQVEKIKKVFPNAQVFHVKH